MAKASGGISSVSVANGGGSSGVMAWQWRMAAMAIIWQSGAENKYQRNA